MVETSAPRLRTKMPPQRGSNASYTGTGTPQLAGIRGMAQDYRKAEDYVNSVPDPTAPVVPNPNIYTPPKKMSMKEFGQVVKQKTPGYERRDDYILAEKYLKKFPQYSHLVQPEETYGQSMKNIANTRMDAMNSNNEAAQSNNMGGLRSAYRNFGETLGLVADTVEETAIAGFKAVDRGLKRDFVEGTNGEGVGNRNSTQERIKKGTDEMGVRVNNIADSKVGQRFGESVSQEVGQAQGVARDNPELMKDLAPVGNALRVGGLYYGGADILVEGLSKLPSALPRVGRELLTDASNAATTAMNPIKAVKNSVQVGFGKQAENLAIKNTMNVRDTRILMEKLAETGDDDVGSVGRRKLEHDIVGNNSKAEIEKLQAISSTTSPDSTYTKVRNIVKEMSDATGPAGKDEVVENAMTVVGKEVDTLNTRAGFEAFSKTEIESIQRAAQDGSITYVQKLRAKELLDEYITIYNKSGSVADTQLGKIGSKLRSSIRKDIEDQATRRSNGKVNLKSMNRDVAVARAMEDAIKTKATANMLKQYALQGSIGGIVAVGQGGMDQNRREGGLRFLVGAFLGRMAGKILGSPAVMGKLAKAFDSVSGGTRKSLLEYAKNPTIKELTAKELQEIVTFQDRIYKVPEIKALPAPEGPAVIPERGLPQVLRPQGVPQQSIPVRTVREKPSLQPQNNGLTPVSNTTDTLRNSSVPPISNSPVSDTLNGVNDLSIQPKPNNAGLPPAKPKPSLGTDTSKGLPKSDGRSMEYVTPKDISKSELYKYEGGNYSPTSYDKSVELGGKDVIVDKGNTYIRITGDIKLNTSNVDELIKELDKRIIDESSTRYIDAIQASTKLPKLLDYPALYDKYPELENMTVAFVKSDKFKGAFNGRLIEVSVLDRASTAEIKNTMLHEIQHWIQKEHGLQGGGSTEMIRDMDNWNNVYDELSGQVKKIRGMGNKTFIGEPVPESLLKEFESKIKDAKTLFNKEMSSKDLMDLKREGLDYLEKIRDDFNEIVGSSDIVRNYRKIPGEQGARLAGGDEPLFVGDIEAAMGRKSKGGLQPKQGSIDIKGSGKGLQMNEANPAQVRGLPKTENSLITEAKKYKSADEFFDALSELPQSTQGSFPSYKYEITKPSENVLDVLSANYYGGEVSAINRKLVSIDDLSIVDSLENQKGRISKLSEEIKNSGKVSPIIADSDGNVIEGRHRVQAMKQLGESEIPAIVFEKVPDSINTKDSVKKIREEANK